MTTPQQETTNPWAPAMVYNPRRRPADPATLLEKFIEKSPTTFYRAYMGDRPNANIGTEIAMATRWVIAIDRFVENEEFRHNFFARLYNATTTDAMVAVLFADSELVNVLRVIGDAPGADEDLQAVACAKRLAHYYRYPNTIDQLVWVIAHPEDAHPGVLRDVGDRFFIGLLLIHHLKHHGGLVLPNLAEARAKEQAHQALLEAKKASGYSTHKTLMHYPNWRDSLNVYPPPGLGGPLRALMVVPTLTSNFPAGRPLNNPALPKGPSSFGAIGDGRRQS